MAQPDIAFLCATYLKPEMRHVYRQITSLSGFDVRVIAQKLENQAGFPFDPIHWVPRSDFRWVQRFRERWFRAGPWQVGRREVDAVRSILREHQTGVLHIFFGNVAIHWLPLLRACEIPVVVSFHGADVAGETADPSHRAALLKMFEYASLFPCRSEALADRVIALGASPAKVRISRTVVPGFPERNPGAANSRRVLQASRLIPKKGLLTTLRAFAIARRSVPEATLMICGDGPMLEELRLLARSLNVESAVQFAGFLDQERLTAELQNTAVFIHPSETVNGDTEGIPNSLLEAMAVGLPVLSTNHGGINEAVTDGESGFLTNEKDVDALGRRLIELLSDPAQNERLGFAARVAVRERFSQSAASVALGEMYRSLI